MTLDGERKRAAVKRALGRTERVLRSHLSLYPPELQPCCFCAVPRVQVERICQYLRPEPEAAPETLPQERALALESSGWPKLGAISVQKITMR